jgi:hypothetical protein
MSGSQEASEGLTRLQYAYWSPCLPAFTSNAVNLDIFLLVYILQDYIELTVPSSLSQAVLELIK